MNETRVSKIVLENAVRRYDEEWRFHTQLVQELGIWLTVGMLILAGIVTVAGGINSFPTSFTHSFRLLFLLPAAATFAAAVSYLRRFFFGTNIRVVSHAKKWVDFHDSLVGHYGKADIEKAQVHWVHDLALAYSEAADDNRAENKSAAKEQLQAKRWIAISGLFLAAAGIFHLWS